MPPSVPEFLACGPEANAVEGEVRVVAYERPYRTVSPHDDHAKSVVRAHLGVKRKLRPVTDG